MFSNEKITTLMNPGSKQLFECLPSLDASERSKSEFDSRIIRFLVILIGMIITITAILMILYILLRFQDSSIRLYIFGALGAVCLLIIFREILRLFAPFPEVTIDRCEVTPGGRINIFWIMKRPTTQIRKLTCELVLEEKITWKSKHGYQSETKDVYRNTIFQSTTSAAIHQGNTSFQIGSGFMHSYSCERDEWGEKDELNWCIRFTADVRFLPDVKHDYPIIILPVGLMEGS